MLVAGTFVTELCPENPEDIIKSTLLPVHPAAASVRFHGSLYSVYVSHRGSAVRRTPDGTRGPLPQRSSHITHPWAATQRHS